MLKFLSILVGSISLREVSLIILEMYRRLQDTTLSTNLFLMDSHEQ